MIENLLVSSISDTITVRPHGSLSGTLMAVVGDPTWGTRIVAARGQNISVEDSTGLRLYSLTDGGEIVVDKPAAVA